MWLISSISFIDSFASTLKVIKGEVLDLISSDDLIVKMRDCLLFSLYLYFPY